jgi:hypothetical protein
MDQQICHHFNLMQDAYTKKRQVERDVKAQRDLMNEAIRNACGFQDRGGGGGGPQGGGGGGDGNDATLNALFAGAGIDTLGLAAVAPAAVAPAAAAVGAQRSCGVQRSPYNLRPWAPTHHLRVAGMKTPPSGLSTSTISTPITKNVLSALAAAASVITRGAPAGTVRQMTA